MGLSNDQRAMLRLLAQREQGYEDIAALMGISVDEVRARVADALAQLEREGKEAPDVPAASAPERPAPAPPAAAEPAPPRAELEKADEPPPTPEREPAPPKASSPVPAESSRKLRLPRDPAIRAAMAAGVLVIALLAIFLIVNGGGGDSDSSASSQATPAETTTGETTGEESAGKGEAASGSKTPSPTAAVLRALDGSKAKGLALFVRVGQKPALRIAAEGLEPTTKATSYTLWLGKSPQRMVALAETAVPKSGRIAAQFEVPLELLAYLASGFDQLVVTRTDRAQLSASLEKATKEKGLPEYTGTPVLSGTVTGPAVSQAKRALQAQRESE